MAMRERVWVRERKRFVCSVCVRETDPAGVSGAGRWDSPRQGPPATTENTPGVAGSGTETMLLWRGELLWLGAQSYHQPDWPKTPSRTLQPLQPKTCYLVYRPTDFMTQAYLASGSCEPRSTSPFYQACCFSGRPCTRGVNSSVSFGVCTPTAKSTMGSHPHTWSEPLGLQGLQPPTPKPWHGESLWASTGSTP